MTRWHFYEIQPKWLPFYRGSALAYLVKLSIISKCVMTAPTSRNDFRQWLNVQSKEYGSQDWTLRNPVVKLLLWRDPTTDTYSLDSIRQVRGKPSESLVMQICRTCRATVRGECYDATYRTQLTNQVRSKWTPGLHQHYRKAVRDMYESCLRNVMRMVSSK